jgi:hypothetical protein
MVKSMSDQLSMFDQTTLDLFGNATSSPGSADGPMRSPSLGGRTIKKSGQGALLAKISAPPEPERAYRGKEISGPLFTASSPSDALQSRLESRLAQQFDSDGSTEFSMAWKDLVTPAGRRLSRLAPSTRRTDASGFGGAPWPGPMAGGTGSTESGRLTAVLCGAPNLPSYKINTSAWPTPSANEYNSDPQVDLERRRLLKEKHGNGNGAGDTLSLAAKLSSWPTTTSRDHKDTVGAAWATPTARDGRSEWGSPEMMAKRSERPQGKPLNKQVLGLTPNGEPEPTARRGASRGALSPIFVAWLMGFPLMWTLAGLAVKAKRSRSSSKASRTAAACSEATETQ